MKLPQQSPPVRRPELVHPHRTVDLDHGTPEQRLALRISLMHGANYNTPQSFTLPGMQSAALPTFGWSRR